MRQLLRSPLLHFLILGAALYALAPGGDERAIVVTKGQAARLVEAFTAQAGRAPTARERQAMIDDWVREEILLREAERANLAQGDTIVRRRLAQKMAFILQDRVAVAPPDEATLRDFFEARREAYRAPPRISFTHAFFRDKPPPDALEALAGAPPDASDAWRAAGDPFMLQRRMSGRTRDDVAGVFGGDFADAVFALPPGAWRGPVLSALGWHFVFVTAREVPPPPEFAAVRDRVADDWREMRRAQANEEAFAALKARYRVVVED